MTRAQFDQAVTEFDARMEQAIMAGDQDLLERLYEECIEHLDGEEPTDEEVAL
jgi:hypothetical protein